MYKGVKTKRNIKLYITKSYEMEVFLCISIYKMLADFIFFVTCWYCNTYKTLVFVKLVDNEPSGCSAVVCVAWKLMWTNWEIQSGQNRSFYNHRKNTETFLKVVCNF